MAKQRIWIVGASGRIGHAITQLLDKCEYHILKTDRDVDIRDLKAVKLYADMNRPEIVINCAGMVNVDECESNVLEAYRVNALGARNLASASMKIGAKFIQISTDDVFGGDKNHQLTEFDPTFPKTTYGKSKLAGENFVKELNPRHLIIRSAWLYGKHGEDFVSTVLKQAKAGETIYAPNDQISSPTSALELAKFIRVMLDKSEYGTFHAVCEGSCTRYHFAKEILRLAGIEDASVEPVFTREAQAQAAEHPRYTVLQNLMIKMTGTYQMPTWEEALEAYMADADF